MWQRIALLACLLFAAIAIYSFVRESELLKVREQSSVLGRQTASLEGATFSASIIAPSAVNVRDSFIVSWDVENQGSKGLPKDTMNATLIAPDGGVTALALDAQAVPAPGKTRTFEWVVKPVSKGRHYLVFQLRVRPKGSSSSAARPLLVDASELDVLQPLISLGGIKDNLGILAVVISIITGVLGLLRRLGRAPSKGG